MHRCTVEEDIMAGIMLQYLLISALLATGTVVTMRLVAKKLWKPFDQTLESIESFRLENTRIPELPESDVKEFEKLNKALNALMRKNLDSYRAQKEFTENASHELQTPLAIFQAKLELLLQQPGLTGKQAEIIQELFQMTSRLSRLNRNLLLLAKIDNDQFDSKERIRLDTFIDGLLPALESISGHRRIESVYHKEPVWVDANRILLESLLNNLIVNAVRHSNADGTITISIGEGSMSICNTSDEPALQTEHIFNRFYRTTQNKGGNGLGLAIVKAICDYHGWSIGYHFKEGNVYYKKYSEISKLSAFRNKVTFCLRVFEKIFLFYVFVIKKAYCSSNNILTQHVGQAIKKAHSRKKGVR